MRFETLIDWKIKSSVFRLSSYPQWSSSLSRLMLTPHQSICTSYTLFFRHSWTSPCDTLLEALTHCQPRGSIPTFSLAECFDADSHRGRFTPSFKPLHGVLKVMVWRSQPSQVICKKQRFKCEFPKSDLVLTPTASWDPWLSWIGSETRSNLGSTHWEYNHNPQTGSPQSALSTTQQ